ncbi:MmyB family transcriptional regulator, partial [Streptomyces fagopyri]
RQDVTHKTTGISKFNHPQVGSIELHYEKLLIPGTGMQALITYHADPGTDSEERLRLLATMNTSFEPSWGTYGNRVSPEFNTPPQATESHDTPGNSRR